MAYKTGTVTSPEALRTAISSFAIRTLGNFDDLFGGALGLSAFGGNSVLGLKHRGTGAVYLFDLVSGLNMNNQTAEHVLLGQLMDRADGAATYNPDRYFAQEGLTLFPLPPPGPDLVLSGTTYSDTISWSGGWQYEGAVNLTQFDAQVIDANGPFSGARPGQALVLKTDVVVNGVTFSNHVFEALNVETVEGSLGLPHDLLPDPAYSQRITGPYLGSYNDNGQNTTGAVIPNGSGVSSDFLLSNFSARDPQLLADTAFNDYSSSMWGESVSPAQISDGFFPRSGRLNFTSGVNYTFYGSAEVGDEHFHMVLQTVGSDRVSHWWMGRLAGDADFLSTGLNPTGMFLGTTGPHTDEHGVDSHQYPFSYQGANEAYKNPSVVLAHFSEDGVGDTIQQTSGGRLGYGPLGANHIRKYGPNDDSSLLLQSKRYSIQAGFNSFQGGEAVGMTGARARTFYPLRPIETEAGKGFDEFYISPWTPVESVLYSLPASLDRRPVKAEDPVQVSSEIVSSATPANSTISLNADGWAEMNCGLNNDPYLNFWRRDGLDGLAHVIDATYDRISVRCRLKTPPVGGIETTGYAGVFQIFLSTVENTGFSGNAFSYTYPVTFTDGTWHTFEIIPTAALWVDGHTLNGFRVDPFQYTSPPTTGAVIEFDYVAIGQTELQRKSEYANSNGAYAIHLGQFPGVSRITMNLKQTGLDAKDSSVVLEDGHFDTIPVVKRGAVGELQRPLNPTGSSGLAGYVYER